MKAIFDQYLHGYISKTIKICTKLIWNTQELVYDVTNCAIDNDLERPLKVIPATGNVSNIG